MSQPFSQSYPRSLPYSPPQPPPTAPEVRLWRWTLLLVGSTAALLIALIVAGFLMWNRGGRRPDPAKSAPARTWARDPTPTRDARPLPPAPPIKPTPEPPPEASKSADRLVEALGGLTAAHLYQAHLNIGLLADSVESRVYTLAEAKKLLETLTSLLDTVDRQLTRVGEQELKPEDQ